ncbi:2-amino-4-hydroxy-6-hydroxymethyldihydropteridine diphosphokinase [Brachybacterium huguangmaarense]|uniref:Bifunctional folate synthesis protein n=1 Tax=Brachybacterium huguangmaarense TaxID=1652028 RepID=A0ABY6G1Z9_9MICO|nr:2-amino-4-hydroxy-6-hydroxymethyldihydropteridine diphosphokinase [Brachybacterium huguangmaarense]UYG16666.1 2-amino-4-hydroxy-6-hydroxymethyldihydropteridine diphosphokinase [Brachybacterium huguangmaarense]
MRRHDTIELTGVRARGHHGVLAAEKRDGQEFVVDVTLHLDTAPAARDDALSRTVDYGAVAGLVVDVVGTGALDLIETLARRLADAVLAQQPLVRAVEVTVHKPSAPIPHPFADVAVRIRRDAPPVPAVLALGTNLGDREAHVRRALELLAGAEGVEIAWTAPVVETDPVGGVLVDGAEQGPYLNTVVGLRTDLGPWELLDLAHTIEADAHRERTVRWGPRTLDVDVVTWGELVQDDPDLTLPHPRAHERAFVLAPWAAARPDDVLPGRGRVADLAAHAPDRDGVRSPRTP